MSFNYLQTDDRDDYFATIGRPRKKVKFALYSNPSSFVMTFNKAEAMNILQVTDKTLVGMLAPDGTWIKGRKPKKR